ncbi:MAG: hypothetical protein GX811_08860, partial [Lentisphaerae bacterium]|nr:hypothetical protein [Lentisphaerota bacterium]
MKKHILLLIACAIAGSVYAKIDLATLPDRDTVQLTIYNSADLTLVEESRALTLKKGSNKLQFSWANTLIDPTSLEMFPLSNQGKIDVTDLVYPARTKDVGVWNVVSKVSGEVPVRIRYFTSGISWRAFYIGTLTNDEKFMRLEGFVRVANLSGEDYENAQTRLIVGKVNLLDEIAMLAKRQYPYGSPIRHIDETFSAPPAHSRAQMEEVREKAFRTVGGQVLDKPKEIIKEGLSEYFLYTIGGEETIPNGWSKRLASFEADPVPVVNLYKYEAERYGKNVMRFLSFKNDKKHKLGDTPIPGGEIRVFRNAVQKDSLNYEGQSEFKYIPVDQEVELNMGAVANVMVQPKLMDFRTTDIRFDSYGSISGWDEVREFEIKVNNTRDMKVKVEITR